MSNAKDLDPARFTAMTRLDHNRAMAQLAAKAGVHSSAVTKMTIWGNHSATQYPDVFHAEVDGKPAFEAAGGDQAWLESDFIPTVQQRGAAIIKARGLSSAASAANAAVDHVRNWVHGHPRRATGCRWASSATAATTCPRGSSPRSRALPRTAVTRSSGPRHRRVQPVADRRQHRRAGRRARRRQRARPDLSFDASATSGT